MIDYAKFDASKPWKYKSDLIVKVEAAGCQYIAEWIEKAYKETGGYTKASKVIGFTPEYTRKLLHLMQVEMKPPGGCHSTNLNKELLNKLRTGWDGKGTKIAYCRKFIDEHGINMTPKNLGRAYNGKTWRVV